MMKQILLITALSLSACTTMPKIVPSAAEAPILLNTKWLEAAPTKVTLNFSFSPRDMNGYPSIPEYNSPEGLYYMGGRTGCNGAGAGYRQDGWSLKSTGAGASTLKLCNKKRMAEDDRLANALANVRTFKINKRGRLILLDEDKKTLLVLKRNEQETP